MDHHPGPAIATLMKLSFDEEHRHAICTLGKFVTPSLDSGLTVFMTNNFYASCQ